ncbi:MAG TPA: zinc dependent phospholipase C family protein [Limnochordia bacterium]|jgi:hypothetical protein|nr:zinc dependent phospholipase C family protein [Bacillota bacterium]HOB09908.1 zinc dependent phospholipase C family protein [Limnochordia bacterium]HPZ31857.1 zinc dependent phospholipase C family protein [Limnochordia bacterium]HQD71557.1 zinc dependent phospholipase C family protein [Limnochordia bacterium]
MPLQMVHLAVAREYVKAAANAADLMDCPEFYLGIISPDAIHVRPGTGKNDKRITHLYAEGDLWRANVVDFIKKNKAEANYAFILGYGIHILTDIIWHDTFYTGFKQKYEQDPAPIQDETWAYYNDTDQLDFLLYHEMAWRPRVWELLKTAKAVDVNGILSSEEVDAWRNHTMRWLDKGESHHKNPIRYISKADVMEFIQLAGETIRRDLDDPGDT